jgi:hypothetical protein
LDDGMVRVSLVTCLKESIPVKFCFAVKKVGMGTFGTDGMDVLAVSTVALLFPLFRKPPRETSLKEKINWARVWP